MLIRCESHRRGANIYIFNCRFITSSYKGPGATALRLRIKEQWCSRLERGRGEPTATKRKDSRTESLFAKTAKGCDMDTLLRGTASYPGKH